MFKIVEIEKPLPNAQKLLDKFKINNYNEFQKCRVQVKVGSGLDKFLTNAFFIKSVVIK